jgi:hypothetical protein
MKIFIAIIITLYTCPALLTAQHQTEKETLTELLYEFLDGASYNDAAIHDRFWAEDLIYTGSNGNRITKADIMGGVTQNPDRSIEPEMIYDGDEVQIQLYGDMAVVAFRLIAITQDSGDRMYFYNTGTFLNKNNEWRAVAWQATRIPD